MQELGVRSLGWDDSLEEEMATHSSILAWRIPWTEETGGLQSKGAQRVKTEWLSSHTSLNIPRWLNISFCQKHKSHIRGWLSVAGALAIGVGSGTPDRGNLAWSSLLPLSSWWQPAQEMQAAIFLVVQWVRLCPSNAGGMGSIPGWGTKIQHAVQCGQKHKWPNKIKILKAL